MTTPTLDTLGSAQADALVAEVVQIYTQLEDQLLAEISASVAKGAGQPKWKVAKLFELTKFRASVAKEVAAAGGKATGPITQALLLSEKMGRAKALAELKKAYPHMTSAEATNIMNSATKIKPLVKETVTKVVGQHAQILRSTDDIYRKVVAKAAAAQTLGAVNHQQAIQKALNEFAANGVTGFVDKSGKSWDLESYTKMATHTAVHRASIEGHVNGLRERGQTLVYVSDHLRECPLCRPWEGKILSTDATYPATSSMAIATLAQAQSAGFMHPYCRHTVNAYFPGITQLPPQGTTADPAGSIHRTQQRALERGVRYWKRREILATTPKAKADAVAHGKEWKAKLNAHKAKEPHEKLNYAQSQAAGYAPPGKAYPQAPGVPLMSSKAPAPKAPPLPAWVDKIPAQYTSHGAPPPLPADYVAPSRPGVPAGPDKAALLQKYKESALHFTDAQEQYHASNTPANKTRYNSTADAQSTAAMRYVNAHQTPAEKDLAWQHLATADSHAGGAAIAKAELKKSTAALVRAGAEGDMTTLAQDFVKKEHAYKDALVPLVGEQRAGPMSMKAGGLYAKSLKPATPPPAPAAPTHWGSGQLGGHAPYTPGQYSGHTTPAPAAAPPSSTAHVLPHKQELVDKAQKAQEAYWHAESTLPPGPETKKKLAALKSASTKATNAVNSYGQPKAPPKPKTAKTPLGLNASKVKPTGNWEDQLLGNGYQPQAFKPATAKTTTTKATPEALKPISKAWADKERAPWQYGSSRQGSYARERYIGSAYMDINGFLRGQGGGSHEANLVAEMDKAFAHHPSIVPEKGLVYRGVRSLPPNIAVGTRFIEPGFSSTSVKEGTAFNGHRYVITVPKGTKVVPGTDYENELILPRTAEFEVTSIETGSYGHQTIHLTLVPTKDQLGTPTEERA